MPDAPAHTPVSWSMQHNGVDVERYEVQIQQPDGTWVAVVTEPRATAHDGAMTARVQSPGHPPGHVSVRGSAVGRHEQSPTAPIAVEFVARPAEPTSFVLEFPPVVVTATPVP